MRRRATWLAWPLLVVVTLAAYAPAWRGGLLWDDDDHLTRVDLQGADGLVRIWTEVGATQQYYPVVHSAFWLMHRVWGDDTLGYHLVTIVLHATSAFLLLLVLGRLSVPGAWLAAGIFALHPVHVESVAWITELKNTLSGVWYLAALLVYLRYDRDRGRGLYAGALGLFVLALLSKSVTATWPAAVLVIVWWARGVVSRRDVTPLLPFFGLGIAAGLFTAWVERTYIGAVGTDFALTVVERGLVAGRAVWFYLAALVWPANLMFSYPRWTISQADWTGYLYPAAAVGVIALCWALRHRTRAPLASALLFVGTLFPALGFFNVYPFRFSFVADHFQYLASLAVIVPVAAVVAVQAARLRLRPEVARVAVAVVALGPLAALTWSESRHYRDAETLYRVTIARNPVSWLAHNNLGTLLLQRAGDTASLDAASAHIERSLAINPSNADAQNNYGVVLQRRGRLEEALARHREAARLEPRNAAAIDNTGVVLQRLGRWPEAIAAHEAAIRLAPRVPLAHYNLSLALLQVGRLADADRAVSEAIRLRPAMAEARDHLATLRLRQGRVDEAIAEYRAALAIDATLVTTRHNLGVALDRAGRLDEAVTEFRSVLQVRPDLARTREGLGYALLRLGRLDEAIAELDQAVALAPDFAAAHLTLGNALHAAGRHDEAIGRYRAALAIDPTSARAHGNLGVALAEQGRLREAVVHFREAVRIDPSFEEARANLARAEAAIRSFVPAMSSEPRRFTSS